jgi:hypothetical protein
MEFTSNSIGEVNNHYRLYTFSLFTHKSDYVYLLTNANEESRLWHKRFGNLNFEYLYQLSKGGMVDGFSHTHRSINISMFLLSLMIF